MIARRLLVLVAGLALACAAQATPAAGPGSLPHYDPLDVPAATPVSVPLELTVTDPAGERDVPVKVYLPSTASAAPVILFSHGLGGSREGNTWLGEHWSRRGYAVVFLQHPGSDDAVWKDVKPARRMSALRHAANVDNFLLRVHDVSAVLDALGAWNATGSGSPLSGRLDLQHVGMAGHSFGAVTTEAVSGERFDVGRGTLRSVTDARISAALMMSPSLPRRGTPAQAFGAVGIPWLLMTGTQDASPIGGATASSRLGVYPALPPGSKYELVLDGAEHSAFGDRALPGDSRPRNPNHHRVILAISTAFWDATLQGDAAARAWLDGAGPRDVLEPADRWQAK